MRSAYFLASLFVSVFACGGAPPAPAAAPSPAPAAPPAPAAAPEPRPALSSAQRPPTLMFVARFNDVDKTASSIDRLFKLSTSARSLIDTEIKDSPIVLSGSLDVAAALAPGKPDDAPSFLWAFSVPLKSVDDAVRWRRAEGDSVDLTPSGAYRVKGKGGDLSCDVMPSLGDAPARGICSDKAESLTLLGPWMARGLAAEPRPPEDVTVRVTFAALKNRYYRQLK